MVVDWAVAHAGAHTGNVEETQVAGAVETPQHSSLCSRTQGQRFWHR